ncbi:MBL fold metallo-hydrolase [Arthrobacter sp. OVS8]|nr:MBL fold metallo-hydrolase [Arthrobacter sp. OVS8]
MLKQVAEGVLVHESEFIQSNSVVVQGRDGVLLIDPGITTDEMADLANDLRELGQPVVAGFSTHPDWDHVLWHAAFGDVPRYGTARCAAAIHDLLSHKDWKVRVAEGSRRSTPTRSRWTCSVLLPVCPPNLRRFLGTAPKSGSSSIRRMPRAMPRS